jgi:cell division FtsZ-interacting protein ZapD
MSYKLLKYIYSAATVPHLMILYYAFFLPLTPSLQLILYLYNTVGAAKSSIFISNFYTTIVKRYSLLATMLSLKSNLIPQPNLQRQLILGEFNLLTLALTPKGKPSDLKEL